MKLKELLGLYNVNLNQLAQTWNFNRFFLLLSYRMRFVDRNLTGWFSGRRPESHWEMSSNIYRPLLRRRRATAHEVRPDVIVVAQHGRFGNMVRQVSLAIASAEKLGIREVIVKSFPQFPRGTWVLDNGVALTHDPYLRSRMIARPRLALAGDFFVKPRLPIQVDDVDFDTIASSLAEAGKLARENALSREVLVVHFRSGDAFSDRPHPGLGQPPLSFYQLVIDHEKPEKVILVFEDRANPVIDGVIAHLEVVAIPYSVQSANFREDLGVLLAARSLITANGTLSEALLMLSPHLQRWISYSGDSELYFRRRPIRDIVRVVDRSEEYSSRILKGNWRNSLEQRELMMSFPASELVITEVTVGN